jgi:multidrug resistance efflux pump
VIRSPEDAYVSALDVKLNQTVRLEDKLLTLRSISIEEQITSLQKQKKALLEALYYFNNNSNVRSLYLSLNESKQDITQTEKVYKSFYKFFEQGTIVTIQLEQARLNVSGAKHLYYSLLSQIAQLNATNMNNTTLYQQKLAEVERELQINLDKIKNLTIRASHNGQIIELQTERSEFVPKGQTLITLNTNENLHIVGFVDPKFAQYIEKDKQVTLYFPDNITAYGVIVGKANFLQRLPEQYTNPIAERSNKIVVIIKPLGDIKTKTYIFGMPLKIAF